MIASTGQTLSLRSFAGCIHAASLLAVFCALMMIASPAKAQPASCDPNYWNALKARAWMEAQREISQNQNLIYKPDSVLELTCFENFNRALAAAAFSLFSETTVFGVTPVDNQSMDRALTRLVQSGLRAYIDGNFSHAYLGGRGTGGSGSPAAAIAEGNAYTYTCAEMLNVWNQAKCYNFNARPAHDDFFYIRDYETTEVRQLPTACAPIDPRWATNIPIAYNTTGGYASDPVQAYANFFYPTGACGAAPATPAIPTGVQIYISADPSAGTFEERICVHPGCAHDGFGNCVAGPTSRRN